MDKRYIEQNNVTERFVLNQLTENELDDFLVYQMMNPEIREEIAQIQNLRNTVRGISNFSPGAVGNPKNDTSNRWIFPVIALVLIAVGVFAFLKFNQPESVPQQIENQAIEPKNESNENIIVPEKTESIEEMPDNRTESKKQPTAGKKKQTQPSTPAPPEPRPIAAADFEPNPYFEKVLGSNGGLRSNDNFEINVRIPELGDTIFVSGNHSEFTIKGITDANSEPEVQLILYSNKVPDYLNETPILKEPVVWKKGAVEGFEFETEINKKLSPGLYYFTIENEMTIYYVGKIWVLNS